MRYNESEPYTEALAWLDSPELLKGTVERMREVRTLWMDVGVDFHVWVHKGITRQLGAKLFAKGEGVSFIEGEKHPYHSIRSESIRTSTEFGSEPPSTYPTFGVCGPWASCFYS